MKVTYLNHSGFLLELSKTVFLFDYYKGEIPNLSAYERILVFVSHNHKDHFNPDIFKLNQKYDNVVYIISYDVKLDQNTKKDLEEKKKIFIMEENKYESFEDILDLPLQVKTLHSTDEGVAFLIKYEDQTIYHAGDLNLWIWEEETKTYNENMAKDFYLQMEQLKDVKIDVAFVPLDPRQGKDYAKGMTALLQTAQIDYLFPMHYWNRPQIITQFLEEHAMELGQTKLMMLSNQQETFELKGK